jgi:hypothetical protein
MVPRAIVRGAANQGDAILTVSDGKVVLVGHGECIGR